MAATSEVTRVVTAVARDLLRPLGLRQQGRSRLWLDDRGWWLIVVEFQPSGWGKGTYLNIGPMWLWRTKDFWFIEVGDRIRWRNDGAYFATVPLGQTGTTDYLEFRDPEQFARDVRLVVDVARRRTLELREQFRDLAAVVDHLTSGTPAVGIDPRWRAYHGGIAAGLSGDEALARHCFSQVTASDSDPPFAIEAAEQAAHLNGLVSDASSFRSRIVQRIEATRQALRLPTVDTATLLPTQRRQA